MKLTIGRIGTALTLAAGIALVASPALASSAPTPKTSLAGARPIWAVEGKAVGQPAASAIRSFLVNLNFRNGPAAEEFAAAVSNPKSPMYGRYLTPAQFNARFSPTAAQVAAVESWLRASGFRIAAVPSNNRYIEASGTIARIDQAFGTTIGLYRIKGHLYAAPESTPSVPTKLSRDILAVTGLDDGAVLTRPTYTTTDWTQPTRLGGANDGRPTVNTPCSSYYREHIVHMPTAYGTKQFPTNICAYTAAQLEGSYGLAGAIAAGHDGHGVTVAITDAYASPTILSDANAFSRHEGVAQFAPGQFTQVLPKTFNLQNECGDWSLEETLDVEAVHSMAPGANIVYVGAKNCANGLGIVAVNDIVANHLASIATDSWLDGTENVPPSALEAEHAIWVQGAAEGIGFNFSSGDDGDLLAVTGETQPSVPASDPMVTAVGGTSLEVGISDNYLGETGWGNQRDPVAYDTDTLKADGYALPLPGIFYAGAGGGTSHVFSEPSYQMGVVPSTLADEYGAPARVVPDVSADADPYTGFEEVETVGGVLSAFDIGGTSLASPLFAGVEAVADQVRGTAIGFANPLLYSFAGTSAFHDVTPTVSPVAIAFTSTNPASICYDSCLITQDHDTSLQTAAGYDNVTGIGSPDGPNFLAAVSAPASSTARR